MKKTLLPTLICVLCFFAVTNSSIAADAGENLQRDPIASLNDYLPESCYQTGRYTQQKSVAGINKLLATEGNFAFACDKGLLWHTSLPLTETLVYRLQGGTQLVRADGSSQRLAGTVQRHLGQMLNHLLGGNSEYLEKTFVVTATETGIQLVPRKKRMEKFLRNIHITRSSDAVTIRMQHQGDEFTAIRVFEMQSLTSLSAPECAQMLSAGHSVAIACQQLLTP